MLSLVCNPRQESLLNYVTTHGLKPQRVKTAMIGLVACDRIRSTIPESAESAIGFGRRLQRHQIAGLRNRGSGSIPTAPTNLND
jgi:hypothetical protein